MAAHRYWRLYCRINAGDGSFTGISEMELRTSTGGADQTGSGTALGSGSIQAGTLAAVFDNSTSTGVQWNGTGTGLFVGYDFGLGNDKDITEINVLPRHDSALRTFGEFDVQSSDDNVTWSTVWSCSYTAWVIGTTVTFTKPTAVAHRYWRLRTLRALNATAVLALAEVEMKETVGGTDATGSGAATARTTFSGFPASNAFDNSSSTLYSSNSSVTDSEWLQYDFGSGVTKSIIEVTLLPRQDSNWHQVSTTGIIESSPDGRSFLERFRYTRMVGGSTYTMRAIAPASLPAPPAGKRRFWGVKPSTVQSGTTFGVAEIELRATVGGSTITTGGGAASLEPAGGTPVPPSMAFDANTATEYASDGTLPDILAYDFGIGNEKAAPAQIKIRARSGNQNQAPTAFDLVYSDDGQNWTTQLSYTSPATWTSSEERLFTGVSVTTGRRRQMVNC